MARQRSPLSGHEVEYTTDVRRDVIHFDDICGHWAITIEADFGEASILGGRLETETKRLTEAETRKVFALARSEVWRLSGIQRKIPLFMTLSGAKASRLKDAPGEREVILTVEELWELAPTLTIEDKAFKTLDNLAFAEGEIGAGVEIPYLLSQFPGRPDWHSSRPPREVGISYGCTETEAPMVYQYLIEGGFIHVRPPQTLQTPSWAFLRSSGYAKVKELRTGVAPTVSQAFMACRFIPEVDDVFEKVIRPVGFDLGCQVVRIKDIHHIDKIDDRISTEIDRSRIVLVDLTEQNFNVAFEAGYALAKNKPIVWTTRKGAGRIDLPFDISTYNCLEWEAAKPDEFREALKQRMLVALQKADRRKA